jgi:hypothetical protein
VRGFFSESGDAAEDFSRSERDLDSSADFDLLGKRGRNGIVELLAERHFQSHASNHCQAQYSVLQMGRQKYLDQM